MRAARLLQILQNRGRLTTLKPAVLRHSAAGWAVVGPPLTVAIPQADWGEINLSRAPLP